MKLILAAILFSLSAMAAETTAPVAEAEAISPKQVCDALAKAAADNNFKAFSEYTAKPAMMGMGMSCDKAKDHKECKEKNCPMHKEHGKKQAKGHGDHDKMACPMHDKMHGGMPSEEGFAKMHAKEMERLKDFSCKEEKVAGDHAWVEAVSQSETRLVPFRMVEGKWKFDMHAYHAFYHPQMDK